MSKYKILWQSSTVIAKFPDYQEAIESHAKRIFSSDFELEVRGVQKGTSEIQFMAFDFLNNFQLFDSVVRAEKEGYDAVAIGCFLDPILDEIREIVNIPVVSLGEAGMLAACMLGKRFSIVSYTSQMKNKRYGDLVHKYGLSERAAPLVSFDLPLTELERGFKNPGPVIKKFSQASIDAIRQGAEVLLPGCGALNLVLIEGSLSKVEGGTVLDVSGALMKMAEMLVILKEVSGTGVSRVGYYEAPPKEMLEQVLEIYER